MSNLVLLIATTVLLCASAEAQNRGYRRSYRGDANHYYNYQGYNGNQSDRVRSGSTVTDSSGVVRGQHGYEVESRYDAYRGNQPLGGGVIRYGGGENHTGRSYDTELRAAIYNEQTAKTLATIASSMAKMHQSYAFYEDAYRRGEVPSNEKYYMDNVYGWIRTMVDSAAKGAQARDGATQRQYANETRHALLQTIAWIRQLDRNIGLTPELRQLFREKVEVFEPMLR